MRSTLIAGALALAVFAAGLRWGAMVAGGADSYGYISQAGLWQQGRLVVHQDIVRPSPWPDAGETWSPLGYRPSPHQRDALVPLYPPGLPLLMALAQTVCGFCGAFLVVPLCGALTVALTFAFGRRVFGGAGVALWGASLVGTSPVFLYQLMNAMSDVPVTAFCTLALTLAVMRRPLASGLAMSVAIAIRPNLAPLALIIAAWLWKDAWRFALGVLPAAAGIMWLNGVLYESPFVSGYGTAGDLYSLSHLGTNVRQFATWIGEIETPVVALAAVYLAAPRLFPPPKMPRARALVGGSMAAVTLSYLFYRPFDAWWYLRFLLPMWPLLMLATAASVDALVRRLPRAGYAISMTAIVALLAYRGIQTASRRSVFDLGLGERRYIDVARFVRDHTEPQAVFFSVQHSGSLRLYADRLTLKFDVLDPLWLDRAVEFLRSNGRHPYFVLDGGEVDAFRQRFGSVSRAGSLDWPPLATLGSVVSIYDPIARASGTPLAVASTHGERSVLACDRPQSWPPVLRMK